MTSRISLESSPEKIKDELLARLAPFGQEHLLAFWEELDEDQRESLAGQIRRIDFDLIARIYREGDKQIEVGKLVEQAEPVPESCVFRLGGSGNQFSPEDARERGEQAIAEGELGVILVAGGQGTRLGFDHPKGMFPIGPVSRRSLFQIHVEKIIARCRRHEVWIPLYLMTSPATHEETEEFFAPPDRLNLAKDGLETCCGEDLDTFCEEHLRIFCQGTMPAVDASTGKVLLERRDRIATSPDGHGGMLAALAASGALDDIKQRGIKQLFYLQVDNPLVDICSPEFIGYHLCSGSEMSTQVIAKQDPLEKVGNVVQVHGRLMVIEYSDLPDDLARRRNSDGSLAIWAGSIAVHVIDTAFLERMAGRDDVLPFHTARKRVAYVDSSGRRIEPRKPNAIKFERFIFDLMPWAADAIVVEVDPAKAFAPLKNASENKVIAFLKRLFGMKRRQDTPETVRAAMVAQHRQWLRQAGVEVAEGVDVEISPRWALDAEEVAKKIEPGTRVTEPTYLR